MDQEADVIDLISRAASGKPIGIVALKRDFLERMKPEDVVAVFARMLVTSNAVDELKVQSGRELIRLAEILLHRFGLNIGDALDHESFEDAVAIQAMAISRGHG